MLMNLYQVRGTLLSRSGGKTRPVSLMQEKWIEKATETRRGEDMEDKGTWIASRHPPILSRLTQMPAISLLLFFIPTRSLSTSHLPL